MTTESLSRVIEAMTKKQLERLKPGQSVRLNSGSPLFTVERLEHEWKEPSEATVHVSWVCDDGKIQRTAFPAVCVYPDSKGAVR